MKFILDGYCGLFCGACPDFLATQNGTKPKVCFGCRTDINPDGCLSCEIKVCARKKGLDFCYQCSEYPCNNHKAFQEDQRYPYHREVCEYMKTIEKEGKEAWLAKMKVHWSCSECSKAASWWEQSCPECGQELNGYKNPEGCKK